MTDTDSDVPDDLGPIDDPGPNDETTTIPKTAKLTAPLQVTKGTGHPGWMGRPVHRWFPIRRSTLLIVLLAAAFEFLHIQYPSAPKATTTAPNGYIPAFIPAVSSTTTTTTTTTQPVPAPTTTPTTPAPNASNTTSTLKSGSGSTTTSTTGVGGTSSTTTTLLPGLGAGSTTTSAPTTTFPS
ncbi:MAG TPA: hypothetical protein VHT49_04510 [Acidimicrobiales bacterium]|jgi:hypothetical protein|nr:hypothetical protein [Acidimicrobiales bacterium]